MAVAAHRPRHVELPDSGGPWSWRVFADRGEAWRFFHRLQEGDPPPRQLHEPHLAPDGSLVQARSWLVIYRPIIAGKHRGDRTINPTEAPCR
jgi:hypothetical protein